MKNLILIVAIAVLLIACGGGGGGGGGGGSSSQNSNFPIVSNFNIIPDETGVFISWENPARSDIKEVKVLWNAYKEEATQALPRTNQVVGILADDMPASKVNRYPDGDGFIIINATANIASTAGNNYRINMGESNVSGLSISGSPLNADYSYTFAIQLSFTGNTGPIQQPDIPSPEVPRFLEVNLDGDSFADSQDDDDDGDGALDTIDNCPITVNNNQLDTDNDTAGDLCDVDANGNGLIDIRTVAELNMMRANLTGESLAGDSSGCGGNNNITSCSGYELLDNIDINDLPDNATGSNWESIGSCGSGDSCDEATGVKFFNATFDGNDYNISNLRIQITEDTYGVGLFGAVASGSELRNVHIRKVNILASDGITASNVGALVGFGAGVRISNSAVHDGTIRGTTNVGGLVGIGTGGTILSSSAVLSYVKGTINVGGLIGVGAISTTIRSSHTEMNEVSGFYNIGGLVGSGSQSSVSSSSATIGLVDAKGPGDNNNNVNAGGLIGNAFDATLRSSRATIGSIRGVSNGVGGLVGSAWAANTASSMAIVGTISGGNFVGGFIGNAGGGLSQTRTSYAVTRRITSANSVGGLAGNGANSKIFNSYWDNTTTSFPNQPDIGLGSPQTTSSLQTPEDFSGIYASWSVGHCNPDTGEYRDGTAEGFIPAWDLGNSTQYPVLTCLPITPAEQRAISLDALATDTDRDGIVNYFDTDIDGDGLANTDDNCPLDFNSRQNDFDNDQEGDVCDVDSDIDGDSVFDAFDVDANGNGLIDIRTAVELNMIRANLTGESLAGDSNGCGGNNNITSCSGYELLYNIDLNDLPDDATGSNWESIGSCGSGDSCNEATGAEFFDATFASNDYNISNLRIRVTEDTYGVGLFGAVASGSELHNIHIRKVNILASNGITAVHVGALVGFGAGVRISHSTVHDGTIRGTINVGGLVGNGGNVIIRSSHVEINGISGTKNLGGIVGVVGQYALIVSSSAIIGTITGVEHIGGILGSTWQGSVHSSRATIGSIIASGTRIGGVVGDGFSAKVLSSAAVVGDISGASGVGGVVGNNQGGSSIIHYSYAIIRSIDASSVVGGLTGVINSADRVRSSYWDGDVVTFPRAASTAFGSPQTTSSLQTPEDFSGIYASWSVGHCNPDTGEYRDGTAEGFIPAWDLGNSTQYPVLTCLPITPAEQRAISLDALATDTDRDGIVNYFDTDIDGDGLSNTDDNCPLVLNSDQNNTYGGPDDEGDACDDTDADQVVDVVDNCPLIINADQLDHDQDMLGDVCDTDDDNDGVLDFAPNGITTSDNCRVAENTDQADRDNDAVGDVCDVDPDNNGLIDIATAAELDMLRNNLVGTGLSNVLGQQGDTMGCPNPDEGGCSGYELVANIDLLADGYSNWSPIGIADAPFTATFEGNNYNISNLDILSTLGNDKGLFGKIAGAVISNVHLVNVRIAAANSHRVGALVGYVLPTGDVSMITNSTAVGSSITGIGGVGGLVGDGQRVQITGSGATFDTITATGSRVGGLLGFGADANDANPVEIPGGGAQIYSSSATIGSISGLWNIGGLVGHADNTRIRNSVARVGTISAAGGNTGGLLGSAIFSNVNSSMAIVQSIAARRVTGGLIGAGTGARVTATAAIVDTISVSEVESAGLIAVVTLAAIKDSYAVTRNLMSTNIDSQGGLVAATLQNNPPTVNNSYWDNTTLIPPDDRDLLVSHAGTGTDVLNTTNNFAIGGIFEEWGKNYIDRTTGSLEELSTPPDITTESGTHTQAWNLDAFSDAFSDSSSDALPDSLTDHYPLLNFLPISLDEQNAAINSVLVGESPVPAR